MSQVSALGSVLKVLIFILYPIAVTFVGLNADFDISGFHLPGIVNSNNLSQGTSPPGEKSHFTYEEYLVVRNLDQKRNDALDILCSGSEILQVELEAIKLFWTRLHNSVKVALGVFLVMMTLSAIFLTKSQGRKQYIEKSDLSEEYLNQLYNNFERRLEINVKFEKLYNEFCNVSLPAIISEFKLNANKGMIQISDYRVLKDKFENLILAIDEQYRSFNDKINTLNFNYELKVAQLIKEFEELKIYNDDCLNKVNNLKKSILNLQDEVSLSESEISQPTVRSIDELRNLL